MVGRWSRSFSAAYVVVLIVITGCSKSNADPKCYPVTGKVIVKGKPAKYAVISFIPTDSSDGRMPAGAIANEDGEFSLLTQKRIEGAEPGEYAVTISWAIPMRPGSTDPEYGPELLPKIYQDPASSGLKFTVEPTENEVPPFDLKP